MLIYENVPKMLQTSNQTKTAELHPNPFWCLLVLSEISAEPDLIESQLQTCWEMDSFNSSQKLLHLNFLAYNYIYELWHIIKLTVLQKTVMISIMSCTFSHLVLDPSILQNEAISYLPLNMCYEHQILNYYLISIKGNILEQIIENTILISSMLHRHRK